MNGNGKGSIRRPILIKRKQFEENWNRIFRNKKIKKSPINYRAG